MMMASQSLPEHLQKPHVRPIQPIKVVKDNQQLVALRDPIMLSRQTMLVPPQVLPVLQAFQGKMTITEIAERTNAPSDQLTKLVQGLDQVGLLWGPTFEKLESDWREKIKEAGAFPARASRSLGTEDAECRAAIRRFLDESEDPELEQDPVGVIAPHLDYERGSPIYAAAYYHLEKMARPDRVVILGTNHFGLGDGVILSPYGFETPLGSCPIDSEVVDAVVEQFGKPVWIDHLDFLPEHSIELQLPWLQYAWGDVPIVAALLPSPLSDVPEVDEDGVARITGERFISTLRETLDQVGGNTFYIAASDLSHVGPQFGEPRKVDDQRRFDVEQHDRDVLGKLLTGDADEFLGTIKWSRNPTRWTGLGAIAGLLALVQPDHVELLDYRQAGDEEGNVLVSAAALALYRDSAV